MNGFRWPAGPLHLLITCCQKLSLRCADCWVWVYFPFAGPLNFCALSEKRRKVSTFCPCAENFPFSSTIFIMHVSGGGLRLIYYMTWHSRRNF